MISPNLDYISFFGRLNFRVVLPFIKVIVNLYHGVDRWVDSLSYGVHTPLLPVGSRYDNGNSDGTNQVIFPYSTGYNQVRTYTLLD